MMVTFIFDLIVVRFFNNRQPRTTSKETPRAPSFSPYLLGEVYTLSFLSSIISSKCLSFVKRGRSLAIQMAAIQRSFSGIGVYIS